MAVVVDEEESDFGGHRGDNDATTDQEPVGKLQLMQLQQQ